MERAAKVVVVLWALAALGTIAFFARRTWNVLPLLVAAAFGGMFVAATISRRAVGLVLALTYVYPALLRLAAGQTYFAFAEVWMAGLLGAILPDALRTGWHVPRPWRPALVCWALTIAVSGTIVTIREFDFTPALLGDTAVANASIGWPPQVVASWTLHVSLVLLVGILWFDWLFGLDPREFRQAVAWPLAMGLVPMVAAAIYQLVVDVTFLNPTDFRRFARAPGTVMDANVCGTIAALWIGGAALLLPSRTLPGLLLLGTAIAACVLAVWASGSRTALAAALLVLVFVARDSWRSRGASPAGSRAARALRTAAIAAIGLGLLVAATRDFSGAGPLERLRDLMPRLTVESLTATADELWTRGGYGDIAAEMVRFAPLFGVGVGGFHVMQADFAQTAGLSVLSPDNAQNWFRHQLAEFGIVGSLPWMAWVAAFGAFVLWRRTPERPGTLAARGMVIAFAAISLVGMPGQEVPTALTFWTAAFWYASLVDRAPATPGLTRAQWRGLAAAVVVFAAGTWLHATTMLRVPARAQRAGWLYSYGMYAPESDGTQRELRWTSRRTVRVIEATTRFLEITAVPNPLADEATVRMRLTLAIDGCSIIDEFVRSTAPITRLVDTGAANRRLILEGRVDPAYRPSDRGLRDQRVLGMRLGWRFVEPPLHGEPVSCR